MNSINSITAKNGIGGGINGMNGMNNIDERIFKIPPKKVIKTNQTYKAQYSQEISFKKGDFFYVIDEDNLYYYIINPAEKISGKIFNYIYLFIYLFIYFLFIFLFIFLFFLL